MHANTRAMAKSKRQVSRAAERASRRSQSPAPRALMSAPGARRLAVPKPQRQQPEPRISFSDDLAARICEHVADGLSLKEACELDGMPSRRTAYKWLGEHA